MKNGIDSQTFKKIVKYMVLFVLACILIFYANSLNVKAASYGNWYDNIISAELPINTRLFRINSYGANEISTRYGESNILLSSTSNEPNYLTMGYYYNEGEVSFGNGNGLGILFPVDIFLKKGSYYSLTLYFGTTKQLTNLSPFTNNRCELTTNNTNYNNAFNNKNYCYYTLHFKQYKYTISHNAYEVPFQYQYALTYMFSSNAANDTYIFIPITDTVNTSNQFYILGYDVSFVGEDQSSVLAKIEEEEKKTQDAIKDQTEQDKQQHEETMDTITGTDTTGADNQASGFFNDFQDNDFGLSDIITLPLTTIQSITSKTCTPLKLTIPFVNKNLDLPCMTTIYSKFEPFYSIYKTISFGIVSYWVCVQIYAMVKGFKNPSSDEIEVMDL